MGVDNCTQHLRLGPKTYMYCHEKESDAVAISGVAYASVVIDPANTMKGISFLAHRHDKKVWCALCRSCLVNKSKTPCQHTEAKDREFRDFFTFAGKFAASLRNRSIQSIFFQNFITAKQNSSITRQSFMRPFSTPNWREFLHPTIGFWPTTK